MKSENNAKSFTYQTLWAKFKHWLWFKRAFSRDEQRLLRGLDAVDEYQVAPMVAGQVLQIEELSGTAHMQGVTFNDRDIRLPDLKKDRL